MSFGNIKKDQYIKLNQNQQMDVEQIAIGTFSPLEGFMGKRDFESVLDNMRLASGEVWTIPIILDVSAETAQLLSIGSDIALCDEAGPMAILHLEEKYDFDKIITLIRFLDCLKSRRSFVFSELTRADPGFFLA